MKLVRLVISSFILAYQYCKLVMMHWLYNLELFFHKLCLYLCSHEDENSIFLSINVTYLHCPADCKIYQKVACMEWIPDITWISVRPFACTDMKQR